ncbi:MAG: sigma-70 family RNA polymerase sigma factor [Clostridia bacterium]|nr:sigma-70 family RNA polymerase sigma factor [Oscillospiraceae bacterium]MBQ2749919.1 sigma-70 family RNA polymerase sigma factor [Clostridia bacterium]MBQ6989679.1 sigma-70 family RNA polymerase sigma factor [Clostridia bacterium]MBR6764678.1 sigma-70 family RNA polymerase sigma factor [Clostridia bacterium]
MPEEELIERLKNGDESAFAELIRMHEKLVFNLALRYVKNYDDASDITQTVFITVYRSIGGFKGKSRLSTWLYRITINECIDFSRRNKLYTKFTTPLEQPDGDGESMEIPLPDQSYDPELRYEQKELQNTIRQAVEALPPISREIIILRDVHDMSYTEIAEALNIELGTVRSRLARARIKLRNKLKKMM